MTTEADGPQFARTFVRRRKGWDHRMHLMAAMASDAVVTAQVERLQHQFFTCSLFLLGLSFAGACDDSAQRGRAVGLPTCMPGAAMTVMHGSWCCREFAVIISCSRISPFASTVMQR